MEKKKETKKKTVKTTAKKTTIKKTVKNEKKKKKGFTLIELLAVIIILGILMIIAIPSVTRYINDSRKEAYVDTAKEIISGARNIVNQGKLGMYDTTATYYIPADYINTENALKSPYGEFVQAYVGVVYDGKGYKYSWISCDDAGQGVDDVTTLENLNSSKIKSDINPEDILDRIKTTGVDEKNNIYVLINGEWEGPYQAERAPGSEDSNGTTQEPICKRVSKTESLHSFPCVKTIVYPSNIVGCYADGYYEGGSRGTSTVTYGSIWDGTSTLKAGDAFDCKVTKNGGYTERFYYVSPYFDTHSKTFDNDYAVLISAKNFVNGSVGTTGAAYADGIDIRNLYGTQGNGNGYGPVTGVKHLPSTSLWDNIVLKDTERAILGEYKDTHNATTNTYGSLIENFSYEGKAARLLTAQEVMRGCGISEVGNYVTGELLNCNFLLEETKYDNHNSSSIDGIYLETITPRETGRIWHVDALYDQFRLDDIFEIMYSIRPAITINKNKLSSNPSD